MRPYTAAALQTIIREVRDRTTKQKTIRENVYRAIALIDYVTARFGNAQLCVLPEFCLQGFDPARRMPHPGRCCRSAPTRNGTDGDTACVLAQPWALSQGLGAGYNTDAGGGEDVAWIQIVNKDQATGLLKEIYGRKMPGDHGVAEVIRVFSTRPELMDVRSRFQELTTFGGSGLGRFREELIAVSISALTNCRF